jgi:hypothetical protein
LVAAWRRAAIQPAVAPSRAQREPAPAPWGPVGQFALLGLAGLVAVGAVLWVRAPQPVSGVLGYSLLWLAPDAQAPNSVRAGISSSELAPVDFHLVVTVDGRRFADDPDIHLAPGQQWEQALVLPPGTPVGVVEAVLFRSDTPTLVYRRATLEWGSKPQ